MRMQDAVPDELEIIPDGEESKHASGLASQHSNNSGTSIPIPKTVVQKVDPIFPAYGEVPGTTAHSIRRADAVPDVIVQVNDPEITSSSESERTSPGIPALETGTAKSGTVSRISGGVGEEEGSNIRGEDGDLGSEENKSEGHSKSRFC